MARLSDLALIEKQTEKHICIAIIRDQVRITARPEILVFMPCLPAGRAGRKDPEVFEAHRSVHIQIIEEQLARRSVHGRASIGAGHHLEAGRISIVAIVPSSPIRA